MGLSKDERIIWLQQALDSERKITADLGQTIKHYLQRIKQLEDTVQAMLSVEHERK